MIRIEREFGAITMGVEDESDEKRKKSIDLKPVNPFWLKLYEVMSYGPKKLQHFKELID